MKASLSVVTSTFRVAAMKPYHRIPFQFSDSSLSWLRSQIDPLFEEFRANRQATSGYYDPLRSGTNWYKSPAFEECQEQLKRFKLNPPTFALFFYKDRSNYPEQHPFRTDPEYSRFSNLHIDLWHRVSTQMFRFNVLIEGDPLDEIVWWNHDTSSEKVHKIYYEELGERLPQWQAIGGTHEQQFDNMGIPEWKAKNLTIPQRTGSFIRTDLVHGVRVTGEKRIVLSLQWGLPWSRIDSQFSSKVLGLSDEQTVSRSSL